MKRKLHLIIVFILGLSISTFTTNAQSAFHYNLPNNQNDDIMLSKHAIQNPDSSYFVTGKTWGSPTLSNWDVLLCKIGKNGDTLWNKSYNSLAGNGDYGYAAIRTHDGNYAIVGYKATSSTSF